MRFSSRQFGVFPVRRSAAALPLSTLLLAALCVLLVAPAAQAGVQPGARVAILTNAIAASASSSQLSALDARQVKVLLSRLEKSDTELSLAQLEREIAALDAETARTQTVPFLFHAIRRLTPSFVTPLSAHEAAHLSGVRTNAYLE